MSDHRIAQAAFPLHDACIGETRDDTDNPLLSVHQSERHGRKSDGEDSDSGEGNCVKFAFYQTPGKIAAEREFFRDRDSEDGSGYAKSNPQIAFKWRKIGQSVPKPARLGVVSPQ